EERGLPLADHGGHVVLELAQRALVGRVGDDREERGELRLVEDGGVLGGLDGGDGVHEAEARVVVAPLGAEVLRRDEDDLLHVRGRQRRVGLQHEGRHARDVGRRHAGAAQGAVEAGGAVAEEARHAGGGGGHRAGDVAAGRHDVGLQQLRRDGGPAAGVGRDALLLVHRAHGDGLGGGAGGRDGAGVGAGVARRRDDDEPLVHGVVHGAADGVVAVGGGAAQAHAGDADVVRGGVGGAEDLHVGELRVGGHALVEALGLGAVTHRDARDVGTVPLRAGGGDDGDGGAAQGRAGGAGVEVGLHLALEVGVLLEGAVVQDRDGLPLAGHAVVLPDRGRADEGDRVL